MDKQNIVMLTDARWLIPVRNTEEYTFRRIMVIIMLYYHCEITKSGMNTA